MEPVPEVFETVNWLTNHFKSEALISIDYLRIETIISLVGVLLEYATPYSDLQQCGTFKLFRYTMTSSVDSSSSILSSFTTPMALIQADSLNVMDRVSELLHQFRERLQSAHSQAMCKDFIDVQLSVKDIFMHKLTV